MGATGGSLRGTQEGPLLGAVFEVARLAVLRARGRGATPNMGISVGPKGKG